LVGEKERERVDRSTKLIQELREAREELLNINFADDSPKYAYIGKNPSSRIELERQPARPWDQLQAWLRKWDQAFLRFNRMHMGFVIRRELGGYEGVSDPEIYNDLRPSLLEWIDRGLGMLDQEYRVKPLLEDYILRVKDTKLAELLKEFKASKDSSPNLVAMGFRTILSLVIQEKAKRVDPTSKTATRTDLAPQSMIDSARNEQILSKDEQRLVDSFVSTHKDIYDFVTHRPTILTDKSEVDTMVDLLNKLLPSIIN